MLDPSTCPVPLPAVDRDGQPWPSYTVASEALEDCSLEPEYWSRRHGSCSDGKRFLSKSTGFSFASYYFREETLVGFSSGGDVVVVICGACTADGQGDVGCEVVEERESFCPASALQCEVGASRCDGARREVCHDSFAGYELVETCTSPEACEPGRCLP